MDINQYQTLAMRTMNPDVNPDDTILNGVMGLSGESGECIDLVKKAMFQTHQLDRDKLMNELGDVAWYLAQTASGLGVPLEHIFNLNINKLKARYPEGFDGERSRNRTEEDFD